MRRALFNVRHGQLWRELPNDTQWFEAEISCNDLDRLQVFPRAQWRKLALGNYGLPQIAQRVLDERYRQRAAEAFLGKIEELRSPETGLRRGCRATDWRQGRRTLHDTRRKSSLGSRDVDVVRFAETISILLWSLPENGAVLLAPNKREDIDALWNQYDSPFHP